MKSVRGMVMATTKNEKVLVEETKITKQKCKPIIWQVFYFSKSNLFRLVIDGKWLPGAFICRDKINEAYETYKFQGYTVKVSKRTKVKVKRTRGTHIIKANPNPPPKPKRTRGIQKYLKSKP
jgi:hypothetical protein